MSIFSRIDWTDLGSRALKTFFQAFAGVLGAWWLASGADAWNQVADVASAKRFALSLLAAVLAAAASALHNTITQLIKNAGGILETDDPEPDDILPAGVYSGPITASQAKQAAPSDQPVAGTPPHAKHEA